MSDAENRAADRLADMLSLCDDTVNPIEYIDGVEIAGKFISFDLTTEDTVTTVSIKVLHASTTPKETP